MSNPTINNIRKVVDPSLTDLLNLYKKNTLIGLNCHHIATVQSFDEANQTITAKINYKKTVLRAGSDGVYKEVLEEYPILLDVPVIILQGGGSSLTMPIAAGDECLILFNDRDIDNWFQSGQITGVASARLHSFSDGFALIGIRNSNRLLTGYDTTRAVLQNGSTKVAISTTKVEVSNGTYDLNTLLQNLVTEIKSLVTQVAALTVTCAGAGNPSSIPINAAAITAISTDLTTTATQIGSLLQ